MSSQGILVTADGTPYRFPEVIDSTILAVFDSCSQKFFHEHILCLASSVISPDLHAGGAFAKGIEGARRAFWFEGLSSSAAVEKGWSDLLLQYGDYEPPPKHDGTDHPKDFINTSSAYFDYFRNYPLDSDPIKPYIMAGDRPAIEFTFAIPLPIQHPITGNPLLYGGRLDMIGYYNNVIAIIDEKTTGQLGAGWESKWRMRGQFLGYSWAAREHGIAAKTAIIRGVAIQKTQVSHLQAIVTIEEWRVADWYQSMLSKVQEMVDRFNAWRVRMESGVSAELANRTPYFFLPWRKSYAEACEAYGGCLFRDLCTSQDPTIWYSSYRRRIWNPLDLVPVKELIPPPTPAEPVDVAR